MKTGFKTFLESEEKKNVEAMIAKLPKGHQKLLNGYKIKYTPGNVLNGDDGHIGYIHKDKIVVAAPWNYGREFTTLHEIGHLVYEYLCDKKWRDEWKKTVKKNPKRQKQNDEELFSMAYACYFAKHKIKVHDHPAWHDYMEKFCQATGN
jgi:hypothetical protein